MIYNKAGKSFKHHIHPKLQKRIRIFLTIGGISLAVVAFDIYKGDISIPLAALSIVVGGVIGYYTSRIFHLSWNHDAAKVIGRIDRTGWIVLGVYIVFEIIRATAFETVIHTGANPTAITFAFVSSALLLRVLGFRGRILKILKDEKVFG
jgi:hypothetical protein